LAQWLKQLHREFVDFLLPRECLGCGKIGNFICPGCQNKLPLVYPPICPACGKPQINEDLCSECWKTSRYTDGIYSVFRFEGIIRNAIHAFKYNNLRAISEQLGRYMANSFIQNRLNGDFLVPVPLHYSRSRERGYNQSALLAKEISSLVNVAVSESVLSRVDDNKPQARTLNVEERRKNVQGIFRWSGENIDGKTMILIDDVCTSTATLEACAMILKRGGAKSVKGFTLAREI
jgi:competence protein ComFC